MEDRLEDYHSAIDSMQEFNDHKEWWIQRKKLWYFSIEHAPDIIKGTISNFEIKDIIKYIEFISLPELSKLLGVKFVIKDYVQLIKINPALYDKIPEDIRNRHQENFEEACMSGWIERVEDKELTRKELLKVQPFIKESKEFKQAITKSFPEDLKKISLRNPKVSAKKTTRFILENTIAVSENEPIELSVIRATNLILNNETSDFSDRIFPKEMLDHESFSIIREKGWKEVIIQNPAFRLALPKDLEVKTSFLFDDSKMKQDLLLKWTKNVEQKPWLLTQKNFVPKSLRYSQEILQSYVRGWIPFIRKAPYKLWCQSGSRFSNRGRANMSYALLRNYEFLNAMIDGYKIGFETKQNYWGYASPSVKQIPACCFCYLAAATICRDKQTISSFKKTPIKLNFESNDPIIKGINDLLKNKGKDVLNLFYGENRLEYFHLSQLQENINLTRKIRHGDIVKVLFNNEELLVFMGKSNEGYVSIKKDSEEYKALIGLRKGEAFQFGPLGGKVIEILDPD
ncbi:MAG: hypothetical protein KKA81_15215 [Bacteroidetes bacterium]|nr:hypothetical protein [Bacteroidota bacterium]